MHQEMKSLHENHKYDLVKLHKGKKALKNKWVYNLNIENYSSHPRYKVGLVVKGFHKKKFSHVVKISYIRLVLSLATHLNLG